MVCKPSLDGAITAPVDSREGEDEEVDEEEVHGEEERDVGDSMSVTASGSSASSASSLRRMSSAMMSAIVEDWRARR